MTTTLTTKTAVGHHRDHGGDESLAAQFARTGLGRDWLHAFARRRIGRIMVVINTLIAVAVVLIAATGLGGAPGNVPRAVAVFAGAVLHSAACWVAWRYGVLEPEEVGCGAHVGVHSLPLRLGLSAAIVVGGALLVVDFTGSDFYASQAVQVSAYLLFVSKVTFTAAVFSPLLPTAAVGLAPAVVAATSAGAQMLAGMPARWDLWLVALICAALMTMKLKLTDWHERLWEDWESDLDSLATLSATEERLAVARDVHDITGSALTTIAYKADLSTMYISRGDQNAAVETRDIGVLARRALKEIRALSIGFRKTDLNAELVGARSLLEAAGIKFQVSGKAVGWSASVLGAFGWVLREGVTNITRHSSATRVTVELELAGNDARMTVTNDGVNPPSAAASVGEGGSGLPGLRERLAAVGGTLCTRNQGGMFTLVVLAPVRHADIEEASS